MHYKLIKTHIMAIRGKVKIVRHEPMFRTTGTVTDTSTKKDYLFEQPFGEQLGLQVDSIVQFITVQVGSDTFGVSLDPVEKGIVESIDFSTGIGVLIDKNNDKISFEQNYAKEIGIDVKSIVRFARVAGNGKITATALKPIGS